MLKRTQPRKNAKNSQNVCGVCDRAIVLGSEVLFLVKDLYGSDLENLDELEDDSESETEDEDGEELTPAVDAAILRTLSKIKKRDPEIYNSTKDVFEGDCSCLIVLIVVF